MNGRPEHRRKSIQRLQGSNLGVGGIDCTPSEDREAPRPPTPFRDSTAEGRGRALDVPAQANDEIDFEVIAPIKDDTLAADDTPNSYSDNGDTGKLEETVSHDINNYRLLRKKKEKDA